MAKISLKGDAGSVPGADSASGTGRVGGGRSRRRQEQTSAPGAEEAQDARSSNARPRGRAGKHKDASPFGSTQEETAPSLYNDKSQRSASGPDYGYSRIRFHKADEVNPYADAEDARRAVSPNVRKLVILGIVFIIVFFLSATLPTYIANPMMRPDNSLASLVRDFTTQVHGLLAAITGADTMFSTYVWEIIAAALAGAALGLSGGVYQGAMKNALASPSTLGVTQGGSLGLVIYGLFFYQGFNGSVAEYNAMLEQMGPIEYLMESFGGFLCTLVACFVIVGLIMLIATIAGRGHVTNISLIIAGQVFATVIGVVITWIRYYITEYLGDPNLTELVQNAQSASFMGAYTPATVAVFAIPTLACMAIVFAMSSRLSLLAFNDDEARSMGISTKFTRNLMVALCTVLTALVVSFTGMIGFVGFLVPHIARRIVGADFRYLLPATALLGAILVVAVHYISYMGIPGFVVGSTGVFTSILGCIVFLVMALRSRGDKRVEWL